MGPRCRELWGYDAPDGVTSWAHALAALGAACPEIIYSAAIAARNYQDDATGIKGARKLANVLVKRLALVRSGVVADSITVRIGYVQALSALGFRKLGCRIASKGLGVDAACIDACEVGVKVSIIRSGKVRKTFAYPSIESATAACLGSLYPVVIESGRVIGPEPEQNGDWWLDTETNADIRAAYPGEPATRPGLTKVVAWEHFAKSFVMTSMQGRAS